MTESSFGLLPQPTNRLGITRFTCRGRRPELQLWLAAVAFGELQTMQVARLTSGQETTVVCLVEGQTRETSHLQELRTTEAPNEVLTQWRNRKRSAPVEASTEQVTGQRRGQIQLRDADEILCGRDLMVFDELACVDCHAASEVATYLPFTLARDLLAKMHPAAVFTDLQTGRPGREERTNRRLRLERQQDPTRQARPPTQVVRAVVQGNIRTPNGGNPGIVPIAWLDQDGSLIERYATDAAGHYRLALPAGETCHLVAGGGSAGRASAYVLPATGSTVRQDFALQRSLELPGVVLDTEDLPLADWRITYFSEPGPSATSARSDNNGSFLLAPPSMTGRCLLWPSRRSLKLPVLATATVSSTGPSLQLRLSKNAPARARLRLRPGLPLGHTDKPVELRLLQMDTGFATHLVQTGVDEAFELEGLTAGFYRGELGAPGLGWVSFGPIHLDGRGLWDCGTITLPPPGRVLIHDEAAIWPLPNTQFACYRQTDDTDVAAPTELAADGSLSLPAGQYALLWRHGNQLRSTSFSVRSAETTTLSLRLSD
ncbi:MAG: hypothetical protein VYE77_07905 [Planctomycetota bacterium]|nr:hypothetical protein [Planctomycetota bacterium]